VGRARRAHPLSNVSRTLRVSLVQEFSVAGAQKPGATQDWRRLAERGLEALLRFASDVIARRLVGQILPDTHTFDYAVCSTEADGATTPTRVPALERGGQGASAHGLPR